MRDEITREEFEKLEEANRLILVRLDQLGVQMTDVQRELGGAPRADFRDPHRPSMRARLHDIESKLATDDLAREALRTARTKTWGRAHMWFLLAIASVGMVSSILKLLGVGG